MLKNKFDTKSRFRILKGGKISLVVSALITSIALSTPVMGADQIDVATNDASITNTGTIEIVPATNLYGIDVGTNYGSISNTGTIEIEDSVDNVSGIYVGTNDGLINNSGTINLDSTKYSFGIRIHSSMNTTSSSVVNDGTIIVTTDESATGMALSDLESSSSIVNIGNIEVTSNNGSDAYGIELRSMNDFSSITNTGTITATSNDSSDAYGIELGSMNDFSSITNTGTITATSNDSSDAYGIYLDGSMNEFSSITNGGTIKATSNNSNDAYGIYLGSMYGFSYITNSGEITATSSNGGADAKAFSISDMEGSSEITNDGIITATSNYGEKAYAIELSDMVDSSKITNGGIITATSSYGESAYGIKASQMEVASSITNTGTITAILNDNDDDYDTYGILIEGSMIQYSSITNEGTITATSNNTGSTATGIFLNKMNNYSSITNTGTIIATSNGDSNDAFGIKVYEGIYDSSRIINSGTITATINGALDGNAYSIYSSYGDGLVQNSGTLNGNIYLGEDQTLINSGTINLPYNASSAYIATLVNSGTIQIGLQTDGTIGNTTHSQLVTGTATFNSGSELYVNVLNTSTDQDLLVGETLDDVITSSNLIINDLTVDDNSALLDFEYIDDGNDNIDLNIVAATDSSGDPVTVLSTTILGGGASTAQDGAKVIDEIRTEGGNGFTNKFNALSSPQVAKAADEFTPQTATAGISAANQIVSDISGIVDQRQTGFINRGLSSGDEMFTERSFWMKPFGSIGEQSDKDGLNGFDVTTYGLGMGIDGTNKDDQQFGLGVFLTKGNVEVNNLTQETDLDAYTVLAYGSTPVIDDKTRFLYQLGYTWQKSDMSKTNLGETVTADYTSKIASLDLKLLRNYQVNEKLLLQPMVSTSYKHFTNPAYSENGSATSGAVDVNKYTTSELLLGIGTLAHYKLDSDSKILANVNVDYDLQDKNNNLTYSYAGQSAEVTSIDNGRLSYDIGIGYERDLNDTSNFNISYNRTGKGSDYSNNTISAKFVYKF